MIKKLKDSEKIFHNDDAFGHLLKITESNDIVHLTIYEGGTIETHSLPLNVIFFIISGSGIITIDGDSYEVQKNDLIEVKANKDRTWENTGKDTLEILVIKEKK